MITWFQLLGDLFHIASFFFLIYRMRVSKSAAGGCGGGSEGVPVAALRVVFSLPLGHPAV